MRGVVHRRNGRWHLDVKANYASLVTNQVILDAMVTFLTETKQRRPKSRLLDLGAGSKPYERLYRSYFPDSTSVDVPHSPHDISGVDVTAWADDLPFADGSFDCVICTEVLEHCPDPAAVVREVHRVLTPGRACVRYDSLPRSAARDPPMTSIATHLPLYTTWRMQPG